MNPIRIPALLAWSLAVLSVGGAGAAGWEVGPGHRRLPLVEIGTAGDRAVGFTRVEATSAGVNWSNACSPERYGRRMNLMNGAGVALGDFDRDGWCDLYFCHREGTNALYRNLGGWQFTNVTSQAGVGLESAASSGALFADFNGDGWLDLHVTTFGGSDALFLNRGDGTFTHATAASGLAHAGGATSSAAADVDGDGDLDLYVARFGMEAHLRDGGVITTRMVGGRPVVTGRAGRRIQIVEDRMYELGEADVLYLNRGDGRFEAADWATRFLDEHGQALRQAPLDFGFTVQMRDILGDPAPEIFVCNDFQTPDRFWLNRGDGRFQEVSSLAWRNMSYASMGVDFADIDRDGFLDFYTAEMLPADPFRRLTQAIGGADARLRNPRDPLRRDAFARGILSWNRGDGTFAEIGWFSGTAATDWAWTPIFLDVDLDGFEDLLVSTGYPHDVNDLDLSGGSGRGEGRGVRDSGRLELSRYPPLKPPLVVWRNRGNRTFEDHARGWNLDVREVIHGMALADLDNDGDLDVVGNVFQGPPLMLRNEAVAPRVAVRLRGLPPNSQGIGAQIRLSGGSLPVQEQEMLAGGRYLSCDQGQRVFAIPKSEPVEHARGRASAWRLDIRWRNGRVSTVADVQPNSIYEVDEAGAAAGTGVGSAALKAGEPQARSGSARFAQVSAPVGMAHADPEEPEFERQPLLPWRQAHQGPGVAWVPMAEGADATWVVGGGRGSPVRVAGWSKDGTVQPVDPWNERLGTIPGGTAGLLGVALQAGQRSLLIASGRGGAGPGESPGLAVHRWDWSSTGSWVQGEGLVGTKNTPGSLVAGDVDGDGDLDVVLAGRRVEGRYPEPADTRVFLNSAGRLLESDAWSRALVGCGLVTGVLLTDLDGDAQPELVLACEWGPIRVFRRVGVGWQEVTATWGLAEGEGIWQGLAAGDFDGDGRMDLAAGNLGLNSPYQSAPAGPWFLSYGDHDQDGRISLIEAFLDPASDRITPFRPRSVLATDLPWLPAAFPTHAAFARAPLSRLLGAEAPAFRQLRAKQLASVILLNRGDHFEAVRLPDEAQWTPVFGFAVADFDGDGDVDLFALQNQLSVRPGDDRMDGGRGLLLWNDGTGRFTPEPPASGGFAIPGEQRGAAVGDADGDGRCDLVVAQNDGPWVLLKNLTATPGWRVRLVGPPANPDAVGTVLRLMGPGWQGPRYEVRAGSGRWSQDAMTQVLGGRARARELWVQYPGQSPRIFTLNVSGPTMQIRVGPESER